MKRFGEVIGGAFGLLLFIIIVWVWFLYLIPTVMAHDVTAPPMIDWQEWREEMAVRQQLDRIEEKLTPVQPLTLPKLSPHVPLIEIRSEYKPTEFERKMKANRCIERDFDGWKQCEE